MESDAGRERATVVSTAAPASILLERLLHKGKGRGGSGGLYPVGESAKFE